MSEQFQPGNSPLISILMPVKNTSSFLAECIHSIMIQNYRNWELIAIDDHSTDTSAEILADFAQKDGRIKWAKNPGNGIIDALQLAFSQSKGAFITRMDSDDIMEQSRLETMLYQLAARGKGHIATGLVRYFSTEGPGEGYKRYEEWLNQLSRNGSNYSEIYKECVIPSPCWMVSKEDLEKCGGFEHQVYPEDYDLCFRFYKNKLKVIPALKVLHYWRDYSERTSRIHPDYSDNRFLELKVYHFLAIDFNKSKQLILWGAGKKGKKIAKILQHQGIDFIWISNNERKAGIEIYDKVIRNEKNIPSNENFQYIIAVANLEEQREIKSKIEGTEYYFFC